MIKSQQSGDENEGFFKPQQKIVHFQQPHITQIQISPNQEQPNQIVNQSRPNDFNARIITHFSGLKPYPEYLMNDKCQQALQELKSLSKSNQKVSKKYLTLQEKYQNKEKFKLVYSKLKQPSQFSNYIFSLQGLTDYNQNHYISADDSQTYNFPQKGFQKKDLNCEFDKVKTDFVFDSNFESGNLLYAFQNLQDSNVLTYDLIIQNDTNTKGYNQWFYFSIQRKSQTESGENTDLGENKSTQKRTIRINIVNFIKKHMMFEDGVRPVGMFQSENQWKFIGRETQYKKSYIKRYIEYSGSTVTKNYYTLSFLLDFPQQINNQHDKAYIALNYPYPYKRAIKFIDDLISQNQSPHIQIAKETLCHTISNNQVPYITISSKITENQTQLYRKSMLIKRQNQKEKMKKEYLEGEIQQILNQNQSQQITDQMIKKDIIDRKKKILILARQHPGQSVGSFVLEGFLKSLMSEVNAKVELTKNQQSQSEGSQSPSKNTIHTSRNQSHSQLLKEYSIHVFPMINVDGVIYGNFRTNLAGFDLNRQWINPNKWLHPEIYYLKKLVSTLKNIQFVMDFHGHSRKLNSFIYACNNPVPILLQGQSQNVYPNISMFRLYPFILSKQCELFSIKDCTYTISRDKIKTARLNTFKSLNYNPYVFTLETGFFGYTKGDRKIRYKIQDFFKIGKGAFESLKTVLLKPKKVKQILKQVQAKDYLFDKWSFENKQDPGSQSNPSEDELNPVQVKAKVLSDEKIKENQKGAQIKNQEVKEIKKAKKKQKTKRTHRKAETELKSQRTILKIQDDQFKFIQEPKFQQNEEKTKKTAKNERSKPLRVQYLADKKKNVNSELFNVVTIKQAVVQKPQLHFPEPNYRERVVKPHKKQPPLPEDFKSTSNLLGTGFSYFQNKGNKIVESVVKTNPATLEMLEVNNFRKDVRIQSFSSGPTYQNKVKPTQNNLSSQTRVKNLFYSLNKPSQKTAFTKGSQRERVYVVRENKIVRIANNVNKTKSQSTILESQLDERHKNLRRFQNIMSGDDKTLIEEIKQQKIEQYKKKKKVYLNPIQY